MSGDAKKDAEHADGAAPKKKNTKVMIIGALGLFSILAGVMGFTLIGGGEHPKEKVEEHVEEVKKPHYGLGALDSFVVNLAQSGSFLKTIMLIEFDIDACERVAKSLQGVGHSGGKEAGPAFPEVIIHRMPMLRDAILRVLASKKAEKLLTVEGKDSLKDEIVEVANIALGYGEPLIVNVYFQEFLIQ